MSAQRPRRKRPRRPRFLSRRPRADYRDPVNRARRAVVRSGRPQALALVSGLALVISVFAPWYRADLGGVFTPDTTSGWDATFIARVVLVLGIIITLAGATLMADQRGSLEIRLDTADRLAWIVLGAAVLALTLVLYRLALPPEPREFFARDWGLFLAVVASACAALSGGTMRFVYS